MEDSGYTIPTDITVTVTTPNGAEVDLQIDPTKSNKITSVNLFKDKEPEILEDGIYCFSLESCTQPYKIFRANLCQAEANADIMLANAKNHFQEEKAIELYRNIKGAKSAAILGNYDEAKNIIELIKARLENDLCKNC